MTTSALDPLDPAPGGRPRRRRRPSALGLVAAVLVAGGLGLLAWVGFLYVGTNLIADRAFQQERTALRTAWRQQGASGTTGSAPGEGSRATPGEAIGLLRIPALGPDYEVPILAGTDLDVLDRGVGHYPGTADPGQVGNFALAGHRVTHGQPFAKLLTLERGDRIVVETRDAVHTYLLDAPPRSLTVQDTDRWVLDPVPGDPGATPTRRLITLTTGQDLVSSPDRSVGFGHLESTENKG